MDSDSNVKVTPSMRCYEVYRGSSPTTQNRLESELSRKRESEVQKLCKDLELITVQHESSEHSMRKRHQETINDLCDQVDYITKQKNRVEKEKSQLLVEIDGWQTSLDVVSKAKAAAEGKLEGLDASVGRLKITVDDLTKQLADANCVKSRLTQENFDYQHQVQKLDSANAALAKAKMQLQSQAEDLKRSLDDESRADFDYLNARYEEESESNTILRNQLSKTNAEYSALKSRYEKEILAKTEKLEDLRQMNDRIAELKDQLEQERVRRNDLEKTKIKLQAEIKEITIKLENTQIIVQDLMKRNRQLENENSSFQKRCDGLGHENAQLRDDKAQLEQELLRLRVTNAELTGNLHEKTAALKDANRDSEESLRDTENKLHDATSNLEKLKVETENTLHEKDEEIENIRRSSARVYEELQRTLIKVETSNEIEISRLKKYETDISELESALDTANKQNAEHIKTLHIRIKEEVATITMNKYRKAQSLIEEAEHRADMAEKNLSAVRRSRSMSVTREISKSKLYTDRNGAAGEQQQH